MDNDRSDLKRNRDPWDPFEVPQLPSFKRKRDSSGSENVRNVCQYGVNCYRRSPSHFKEFKHVDLEALFMNIIANGVPVSAAEVTDAFPDSAIARAQLNILLDSGMEQIIKSEGEATTSSTPQISSAPTTTADNLPTTPQHALEEGITTSVVSKPSSSNSTNSDLSANERQIEEPGSISSTSSRGNLSSVPRTFKTGTPLEKWETSSPYNFFLTAIPGERRSTHYSLSFQELFHPSFGDIEKLCHFNFMVEVDWYLDEIQSASVEGKETTIVFGVESPELEEASRAFPWLTVCLVKSPFPFGHHHTKMSFIQYSDGSMRFIVYTANLIESDWDNRTQGIWMSPRCPKMVEGGNSNISVTGSLFKSHLIEYLNSYPSKCGLSSWISAIRKIDTTEIKVLFVGSAPVTAQSSQNGFQWGQKKVESMLKRFKPPSEMDSNWPLHIQCSSIGSLGPTDEWLRTEFGRQLGPGAWSPSTPVKVVYPSDQNVRRSVDGIFGGSCLPYSRSTHARQTWLKKLLHQWKSDLVGRSRNMPHIKTYGRVSPDGTKLAWFVLTSANLSKAAWGKLNKNQDRLTVMSWEAGVLFIPQHFGSSEAFRISTCRDPEDNTFRLPYDIPLTKYEPSDEPWNIETLRDAQ